jgi:hypothetical protein
MMFRESGRETAQPLEGWAMYFNTVNDQRVFNVVDLYAEPPEDGSLGMSFQVKIDLIRPDEDGLSTQSEDRILSEVEQTLTAYVREAQHGQYVGRSTQQGARTYFFYLENEGCPDGQEIRKVLWRYNVYPVECFSKEDENWACFSKCLYPSPDKMTSVQHATMRREDDVLQRCDAVH